MTDRFIPHRSAVASALETLATVSDYGTIKQELQTLIKTPHGGFVGTLANLNVLVEYGRAYGGEALRSVWAVAERKRQELGLDQPALTPEEQTRKTRYQASYMAQRRARLRKAVALYQKLHQKTLQGAERRAFQDALQATWMTWRNELLEGVPPGDGRNEVTRMFWEDIDAQLDVGLNGDTNVARRVLAED